MKNSPLIIAATLAIVGIAALTLPSGPERGARSEHDPSSVAKAQAQPKPVTMPHFTAPQQATTAPPPDPHEQWLDTLYESPSIADRLVAARQIAARNDERGMSDLATFIGAAEENGDASLLSLASQVAEMVGEMHGPAIEGIAIELAYSPSALIAEAAVNAAVKSLPAQAAEEFTPGAEYAPADQQALDRYVQQLLQAELQNIPPLPDEAH